MLKSVESYVFRLRYQFLERRIICELEAQNYLVGEVADEVLKFSVRASRHRNSNEDVVLTAVLRQ